MKESGMEELIELLNKLIEKGWKPRGIDQKFEVFIECLPYKKIRVCVKKPDYDYDVYSYRELVSKSSGLWQFCMSKGFTPNVSCYRWEKWLYDIDDLNQCEADVSGFNNYGYRLIESALCDEDKLEQFLLDNIKI